MWIRRFAISFIVGYLVLYLLGPHWLGHYKFEYPDSSSYFEVARRSPLSPRFWFDQRPPTYPLLIWLARRSHLAIVVVQTALSFAAWIWLVVEVRSATQRKWLSYPAVVMLIAVGLQSRWIFWDTLVLTESLSATLAVAMLAGWLWWWAFPTRRRAVAVAALIVAWMLLRDSNAVTWLVVAAPATVVMFALVRRATSPRRRGALLVLSVCVIAGGYSLVAQATTDRGDTSFHNNVGLRWLPSAQMRDFMVARGMPFDAALSARAGRAAWDDGQAFLYAPDLADYRQWAHTSGRTAALSSFVLKAPWYLDRFAREASVYAEPSYLFAYDHYLVHNRFPDNPLGPIEPVRSLRSLLLWGILAAGALALVVVFRRGFGLMLALLWTSVIVDSYLSFCADAIEVGRHLVGPWLRFSVTSIVVVTIGIDSWLSARAARVVSGETGDPSTEAIAASGTGARPSTT